jgi:SPP1 gp7 family putative phage head morphogenesis protein
MSDPVLQAVALPFDEAVRFLRAKVNRTSFDWTDVWGAANARAFAVAGAASEAIVADFREAVDKAIADGETLQQFRARFDEIVRARGWTHRGSPGWRARVIYETNLATAYAAGRYVEMTAPETAAAFPYWQYVHSGKKHYREAHKNWNGTVLRADDPFWSWAYPPNGYNCGCWVRPLSGRAFARTGRTRPDPSPPRQMRRIMIKSTGELKAVSEGVDPGFDTNPGADWARRRPPGD